MCPGPGGELELEGFEWLPRRPFSGHSLFRGLEFGQMIGRAVVLSKQERSGIVLVLCAYQDNELFLEAVRGVRELGLEVLRGAFLRGPTQSLYGADGFDPGGRVLSGPEVELLRRLKVDYFLDEDGCYPGHRNSPVLGDLIRGVDAVLLLQTDPFNPFGGRFLFSELLWSTRVNAETGAPPLLFVGSTRRTDFREGADFLARAQVFEQDQLPDALATLDQL